MTEIEDATTDPTATDLAALIHRHAAASERAHWALCQMQAAVALAQREGPATGMQWLAIALDGVGLLPPAGADPARYSIAAWTPRA